MEFKRLGTQVINNLFGKGFFSCIVFQYGFTTSCTFYSDQKLLFYALDHHTFPLKLKIDSTGDLRFMLYPRAGNVRRGVSNARVNVHLKILIKYWSWKFVCLVWMIGWALYICLMNMNVCNYIYFKYVFISLHIRCLTPMSQEFSSLIWAWLVWIFLGNVLITISFSILIVSPAQLTT